MPVGDVALDAIRAYLADRDRLPGPPSRPDTGQRGREPLFLSQRGRAWTAWLPGASCAARRCAPAFTDV